MSRLTGFFECVAMGDKPMGRLRWWAIKKLAGKRGVVLNAEIEGTIICNTSRSLISDGCTITNK